MPYKWLTPGASPDGTITIKLIIPKGDEWEAAVRGALLPLCDSENWEQHGSYTPDQTAEIFTPAILDTLAQWDECV